MPILFDQSADTPQTHVLIIGVGGYPYLKGGISAHPPGKSDDRFESLGQLTSPSISGIAFMDAVFDIQNQNGWLSPLGSVDVLLSAPDGKPVETQIGQAGRPTLNNIKDAYDSWKLRCSLNAGNIAIFYFCGHGLEKIDHFLLAEDFLQAPQRAQENAFNINDTRRAFHNCKAARQLFFIDACREVSPDILMQRFEPGALDQQPYIGLVPAYSFIQHSTVPTKGAFARPNEVSIYTKALISALKGQAAVENGGDGWLVTTAGIASKMHELIGCQNVSEWSKQFCTHDFSIPAEIVKFDHPPEVNVDVMSDPDAMQDKVRYACYHSVSNDLVLSREPAENVWSFSLKAGAYRITGQFSQDPKKEVVDVFVAEPPRKKRTIKFR